MTNSKFNLAAALETLRRTKRSALDKLLMDTLLLKSAAEGNVALVDAVLSDFKPVTGAEFLAGEAREFMYIEYFTHKKILPPRRREHRGRS